MKSLTHKEDAFALVLTLAILVIATVLVVGFATSMRTERQASAGIANSQNAAAIAQAAIDHAVSLLDLNIPKPLGPGVAPAPQNWFINPGQLTIVSGAPPGTSTVIPLHSGAGTATDPDLNQLKFDGTNHQLLGADGSPMRVAWLNMLKDPTVAAGTSNPLVGRYAFWVDDENSKVNLNTAYGKPYTSTTGGRFTRGSPPLSLSGTTYTLGHPLSVDLSVFPDVDAPALRTVTQVRNLQSLEEIKAFLSAASGSTATELYEANKFSTTTFNGDPEFNAFGKSRIFIADSMYHPYSESTSTGPNPYWDTGYAYRSEPTTTNTIAEATEPLIVHSYVMNDWNSAGYDKSGGTPTSDSAASNPAVAAAHRIANYLNTPWPGYTKSFVDKYGKREAEQIAWNIYAMAASASTGTTTAQSGSWANTTHRRSYGAPTNMRWSSFLWDGPLGSAARILPQTRSALLSKVGVGVSVNNVSGSTTRYRVGFRILFEAHLPSGYQGYQSTKGWSVTNDRIFIQHLEATVNGQRLVLASTTDQSALKYYPDGDNNALSISTSGVTLDANADATDGDRKPTTLPASGVHFSTQNFGPSPGSTWVDRTWPINQTATQPDVSVTDIRIRFVAAATSSGAATGAPDDYIPYQISPIRDVDAAPGFEAGNDAGTNATNFGSIHLTGSIALFSNTASSASAATWSVMETTDPRVNQLGSDWHATANSGTLIGNTDVGSRTLPPYPASTADGDESKLAFLDTSQYVAGTFPVHYGGRPHDTDKRMSSVGWLSCVSTGIQSGKPWRTLKFQPGGGGDPPDWLLMDLFAVPFNELPLPAGQSFPTMTGPAPITYMNSTSGKINLNTKIYPDKATSANFAPTDRLLPIRAMFENTYRGTTQFTSTDAGTNDSVTLAKHVLAYQQANGPFSYAGQLCEVPGVADTGANEWEKEAVIRNLGSIVTTRSNAFSVWGVAQTVKKNPANATAAKQGSFETKAAGATADDIITGERRFHAVIERYIWPGVDGAIGNAQTATGSYSQLGTNAWLASPTNVVDGADPTAAGFDQSYNPKTAVMKYRIRSFEYLND